MRIAGHHILRPESADPVARSVELCESRELRPRSPVSVRSEHPRQMNPRRPHIRRVPPHPPEIVLDPSRVRADVPVLEMSRHHADAQQLRFITGRQRFQVLLKLRQINRRVRRHLEVLPDANNGWPEVVKGSGTCNGTIVLEKGTGTLAWAVTSGCTTNGNPPVTKLSCHKFGKMVVIAPPACTFVFFVSA